MKVVKKIINGNEYEFFNNSRGNYSGFVHETNLFKNGIFLADNKIQYYNRTWEVYTYQSVMKGLVYNLMENLKEKYKNDYKAEHGIKRLTAQKKEQMLENFENDTPVEYAELKELYDSL